MRIEVTQEHIERGIRGACGCCPVALAIHSASNAEVVSVSSGWAYLDHRGFVLPPHVRRAIDTYDDQGVMIPFTFELEGI